MGADLESIAAHRNAIGQIIPLLDAIRSVAEIGFRRSEERLRPLDDYSEAIAAQLAALGSVEDMLPVLPQKGQTGSAIVVITSERGLCGVFNERLVEEAAALVKGERAFGRRAELICLGSQGLKLLEARKESPLYFAALPSFMMPAYPDVEKIALDVLGLTEQRGLGRIVVVHNATVRRFQYETVTRQLFPMERSPPTTGEAVEIKPAGDRQNLLTHLVTERVLVDLYRYLVQSTIAEQLARVAAMRMASDNAERLLEELTWEYNVARQESETNSLLEVISGYEVSHQIDTSQDQRLIFNH